MSESLSVRSPFIPVALPKHGSSGFLSATLFWFATVNLLAHLVHL